MGTERRCSIPVSVLTGVYECVGSGRRQRRRSVATAPGGIRAGRLLQSGLAVCTLDLQHLLPSERKQRPAWPHRGCRWLPLSSRLHFSSFPHIYLGFLQNREEILCNSQLAIGEVLPRMTVANHCIQLSIPYVSSTKQTAYSALHSLCPCCAQAECPLRSISTKAMPL